MEFRLDRMKSLKSDELSEMNSIIEKNKSRKRAHYNVIGTLTDRINIITELKHSSPSAGRLSGDLSDEDIIKSYISGGASAVSVLTEKKFFSGSYSHLENVCSLCDRPVLCKDFVYYEEQIEAAFLCGADMVLLIARTLDSDTLGRLYNKAVSLNISPLVEIHEPGEIDKIMKLDPELVLVNMRNLETLQIDFNTGIETLKALPGSVTRISASGINTKDDISFIIGQCGVNNFLIGSSLMTSGDPERTIREFKNVY